MNPDSVYKLYRPNGNGSINTTKGFFTFQVLIKITGVKKQSVFVEYNSNEVFPCLAGEVCVCVCVNAHTQSQLSDPLI